MEDSLSQKLRVARAEKGLSLRRAAEITGVTKETLIDLEHGRRQIQVPTLSRIAQGYGMPIRELMQAAGLLEESIGEPGEESAQKKAQAPLSPDSGDIGAERRTIHVSPPSDTDDERRDIVDHGIRRLLEHAIALGEDVEAELRAGEGDPVLGAALGPSGDFLALAPALRSLFDWGVFREAEVSEPTRQLKLELDAVISRVDALLSQASLRSSPEQRREFSRFRRRAAAARREQQEGDRETGAEPGADVS